MYRILSIQGITLFSASGALAIVKLLPHSLPSHSPFLSAFGFTFGISFALYTVFWRIVFPFYLSPLRQFPTFKGRSPFQPYSAAFLGKPQGEPFLNWVNETPNDGLILLRSVFETSRLLLTSPRALADVLVNRSYDFEKQKGARDFLRQTLGDGLVCVEGDVHKFQRKHAMPAFSFRHIKELYPMMWSKSLAFVDAISSELQLESKNGDSIYKVIELNSWASKVTLDIMGVAGIGRDFNSLKNTDDELAKLYQELLEPSFGQFIAFIISTFSTMELSRVLVRHEFNKIEKIGISLRAICRKFIANKRASNKPGSNQRLDILSLLLDSGNFSDDDLVHQLLTFLAAGHETSSSAFAWIAYLLAINPNTQTKLREEVRQAFPGQSMTDPAFDIAGTLEKLPYLNGVCNETLRLYPTVPMTFRVATADTTVIGLPIPKGTELILPMWAVNRSSKLWGPDADSFLPERWISEDGKPNNNGGASSNYALLTFLHGPRSCIGQHFAKAELRCITAAFILAFEWELDMKIEEVIPAGSATIKPRDGLRLKLKAIAS